MLTNFIGTLPPTKVEALNQALLIALDIRHWPGAQLPETFAPAETTWLVVLLVLLFGANK